MEIFRRKKSANGRSRYYFLGVKVASFRNKEGEKNLSQKELERYQKLYKKREHEIAKKMRRGNRPKILFLVGMPSMFPARPLMERMLEDGRFAVSVLIIPDLRFGLAKAMEIQLSTIEEFKSCPVSVKIAPLGEEDDEICLEELADVVFLPTPYDISHPKYNLRRLADVGILPAIVNYGFFRSKYDRNLISNLRYGLYWKVFAETHYNMDEYRNYAPLSDRNVELTGYCKMDGYRESTRNTRVKTIMIASHHSLLGGFNDILALSNFESYSDFFLELPDKYPQLSFIFRPHPALFIFLSREDQWGRQKVEEYIMKLKSKNNVIYSEGGDYFKEFSMSDALIDDCGSYLVEYFYTGKPQCYMLKDSADIEDKFVELGKKCLLHCYLAYSQDDIIRFIDSVVIKGADVKKAGRKAFAEKEVMLGYPDVAHEIIDRMIEFFSKGDGGNEDI